MQSKEERLGGGLGGSLLNRIGNPLVIPKPFIPIERLNMNGFEELFFPLLPQSSNQFSREEYQREKKRKKKTLTQTGTYPSVNGGSVIEHQRLFSNAILLCDI